MSCGARQTGLYLPPTTDEAGAGPSEPQRHDTAATDSKPDVSNETCSGAGSTTWSIPPFLTAKDPFQVQSKGIPQISREGHEGLRVVRREALGLPSQTPDEQAGRNVLRNRSHTLDRARLAPPNLLRSPTSLTRVSPPTTPRRPHAVRAAAPRLSLGDDDTAVPSPKPAIASSSVFLLRPRTGCSRPGCLSTYRVLIAESITATTTAATDIEAVPAREAPGAQHVARLLARKAQSAKPDPQSRRVARRPRSSSSSSNSNTPSRSAQLESHNNRPAAPVFEPPPPVPPPTSVPAPTPALAPVLAPAPAPAPLRTGTTSNAAGTQRRRASSKRTSREAELDLDADGADAHAHAPRPNRSSDTGDGMDVDAAAAATARDPRAPEKENTIRRRLKGGPAAVGTGGPGTRTRKMTAAAAATAAAATKTKTKAKSESSKSAAAPAAAAAASAHAPVFMAEPTTTSVGVGGAAGRLLAAARGSAGGGGTMASGPRRVPIDSTEAAAGLPARRVS
ncbi:hypothetical protein BC826DRAFT_972278 [Russula brevipes]|nr:hypothetical protein BC826DRAFT_972278 [Russula brevipes]